MKSNIHDDTISVQIFSNSWIVHVDKGSFRASSDGTISIKTKVSQTDAWFAANRCRHTLR